ncbi:hypothetical protein GC209_13460 [bacterium]|nr:hypothetical protein [bacterium]
MTDNAELLVAVFKEIAVIQGKRRPDGSWAEDAKPWHVQNALQLAAETIAAALPEKPPAKPTSSSRKG